MTPMGRAACAIVRYPCKKIEHDNGQEDGRRGHADLTKSGDQQEHDDLVASRIGPSNKPEARTPIAATAGSEPIKPGDAMHCSSHVVRVDRGALEPGTDRPRDDIFDAIISPSQERFVDDEFPGGRP